MKLPFKPRRNVTNDWKKARVYPVLGGECFEAIYLGAKISEEDLQKAINLARKINKDIKIYQMEINPEAFKLDVREIGQGA
jgi:hypothetical protein